MTTMSENKIRQALREKFGTRRYRITRNNEIHVFGVLLNTNATGWYFYGYLGEKSTEERIKAL